MIFPDALVVIKRLILPILQLEIQLLLLYSLGSMLDKIIASSIQRQCFKKSFSVFSWNFKV